MAAVACVGKNEEVYAATEGLRKRGKKWGII